MGPQPRLSSFARGDPVKPSPAKSLLQWLKKAIGIRRPRDKRDRRSRARENHSRHTGTRERTRTHSFSSLSKATSHPSEPELEEKHYFHTAGSKYIVQAETAPRRARTEPSSPLLDGRSHLDVDDLLPSPHVLIVGASLSGLCLAQGLKRAGIPFTVFDGDKPLHDGSDGYNVHIDPSGYDALKAMLPDETFDLFLERAGQGFPEIVHMDASTGRKLSGELLRHTLDANQQVFSMDRTVLRSVLSHGLKEGSEIQYRRVFKRYHVLPDKTVEVNFTNGLFVRGSILVGADGRASRVRDQLVPPNATRSLDTGCGVIYGKTRVTSDLVEANLATCSSATIITSLSPKAALWIEPVQDTASEHSSRRRSDQYVSWALLARSDHFLEGNQASVYGLEAMAPHQIAEVARTVTSSWHPLARVVVDTQSPDWSSFHRITTTAPEIATWAPTCVTLIGDAAHVMPPATGGGVNLALQDATVLCERLVHVGVSLPAIAMYEKLMRLTAYDAVLESVHVHRLLVGMPPLERMAPACKRGERKKLLSRSY